jgi:branched-chain amino acid transport system permease protein
MQVVINGIVTGLMVALLGLGFGLVYFPTRVFHVAQTAVWAIAPVVAFLCLKHGLPLYVCVGSAVAASAALSVLCEIVNHRHLQARAAGSGQHMIASVGISLAAIEGLVLLLDNMTHELPLCHPRACRLGALGMSGTQSVTAVTSVIALSLVWIWLSHGGSGRLVRAMASNPEEFVLSGYDLWSSRRFVFVISGALTAVAAIAVANDQGFNIHDGQRMFLFGCAAALVSGRLSVPRLAAAGTAIGVTVAVVTWALSAEWQQTAAFAVLAVSTVAQRMLRREHSGRLRGHP